MGSEIKRVTVDVPVKAIASEVTTGTDDEKFVTPAALAGSSPTLASPTVTGTLDLTAGAGPWKAYTGVASGAAADEFTVTMAGETLSTVDFAKAIPFQTTDGSWFLHLMCSVTVSSSTTPSGADFGVSGVNWVTNIPVMFMQLNQTTYQYSFSYTSTSDDIKIFYANAPGDSITKFGVNGTIPLNSKPTWAD